MRVLYIGDRRAGGIASHVKCLTECLPSDVERYVIGIDGDEPFAGRSGHDIREFFQIRRVIREFKPDIVHFHIPNLFMAFYIRLSKLFNFSTFQPFNLSTFQPFNLFCSWHTPTNHPPSMGQRLFFRLLGEDCYYLPVSIPTWEGLRQWLPSARGEVFFNSINLSTFQPFNLSAFQPFNLTVGMVGRNADQKDWPAFHRVEELVKGKVSKFQGFKVSRFQGFKVSGFQGFKVRGEDGQYGLAQQKVEGWLAGVTRDSFDAALKALVEEKTAVGEYRFKRDHEKELAFNGAKRFFDEFSRKIITLSDGRCVYFAPDPRSVSRNDGNLSRCWAEYAFHAVSNGGRRLVGKDYNERWYHPHKAANFGRLEETLKKEHCFVRLRDNAANDSILFWGDTLAGLSFDVVTRLDEFGNMDANLTEVTFEVVSRGEKKLPRLVPLTEAVRTVVHHQTTAGSYPSDGNNIPNFFCADKGVQFLNAGEKSTCDGREAIAKMDLFVMTSKHEELPTTVLECFALGTPVCGFIPVGGMSDILKFSTGPLREVFIAGRSCEKLADIVMDLLAHPEKRQALIEDGRRILENHFDAEKNCRGRLMEIYEKCTARG